MDLLIVVTGMPDTNSPARSVFNLTFAQEVSNQGHHVTILYLRALRPRRPLVNITDVAGLECIEVSCFIPKFLVVKKLFFLRTLFEVLLSRKKVYKKLKQVDVIHAIGGGAVEAAFLVSSKFKTPMISQFIGSDLNVRFKSFLESQRFLDGIARSNFLCFNSKGLRDVFLARFPKEEKLRVMYRGVKLADFPYVFQRSTSIKILFLGGFPGDSNLKGGYTLIETIKLLNNEELSTTLQIAVGGPNSLLHSSLSNEIDNSNIILNFIGAVDKVIVKEKMRESHIVVVPSLAEGVPNVIYEAMASGNMVIGTEVGGIPEILESKVTGEVIPVNDPKALKFAILAAIADMDQIEEYAINGRRKIESMDYDKFINGYLDIYESLLNK